MTSTTKCTLNETVDSTTPAPKILTRIYVTPEGHLIVTDMWEEIREALLEGELGGHFFED
jgi:hypothetical protein